MTGIAGLGVSIAARSIASKAVANAKRDWAALPPKAKLALLAAIAAVALFFVHQHFAHKALKAQYAAGYAAAMQKVEKQALELKRKTDAATAKIAEAERKKNDEQAHRIAAAADDLRVRGPGKAGCAVRAGVPAAAGRHEPAGGKRDAAGPQVPADELAAVPWGWLVGRAEEHDLDRAEVLSWRSWYERMVKAWPKAAPQR